MSITHMTEATEATRRLGMEFGATLRRGDVVGLIGALGSGKTQFVKGICSAFHVDTDVLSPSFVLMHRYEGKDHSGSGILIHHFDFYRIGRPDELDDMGFRELIGGEAVSVVEWADAFPDALPSRTLSVRFEHGAEPNLRSLHLPDRETASL